MIINIPTKADFDESANNLLNLAWDQITALLNEYSQLSDTFYDTQFDESDKTRYWNAARQTLTTSLTLIQQAVEFFIKRRMVAISPFLIISGTASSWPKGAKSSDISFGETFKPYRKVKDKNYDCVICGHYGQLASTGCT
ncbi:hypothetical protein Q4Q52_20040 [Shewanella sp. SP1S2-4]|uniref:hypothetical protein n=1 Tax=Shewanella sp. SP1S2-4 TaxID=3063537 RepID=UPI00288DC00A|nr:hypothetical protein [Shewanella sp. SP1S2-4]MDT3322029.1 hypothetical protein [Shewanella sp. SP1S2-4]